MSPAVARWRWRWYAQRLGEDSPRVRALFGRYVATVGGWLHKGPDPAYTAWARLHLQPGYSNRGSRSHSASPCLPACDT